MAKTVDMTRGNAVKHILLFSIPLLIGNLFQQVYNLADSVIVGQLVGSDALAATGVAGWSHLFLYHSLVYLVSSIIFITAVLAYVRGSE